MTDRAEIRSVIRGQGACAQMEIGQDDSRLRTPRDDRRVTSEVNLAARHADTVEPACETRKVTLVIVDCDHGRVIPRHLAPPKTIATTAPSHSSGTSTSPRAGNASRPPLSSIARLA